MMTCGDVNAYFDRPFPGEPAPEVLAHAAGCPGCRALLAQFQAVAAQASSARETRYPGHSGAALIPEGLLSDLKPVRRLPSGPVLFLLWVLAAAVVSGIGLAVWGSAGWHAQSAIQRFVIFGGLTAAVAASGYGLTVRMAPGSETRFPSIGVQAAALAAYVAIVAVQFHHSYRFPIAPISRLCFLRGLYTAGFALLLVMALVRWGVWLNRLGACLQVAAFLSASSLLVLTLYCPVLSASHVFSAHLGSVAVVLLLGWALGKLSQMTAFH